MDAPVNIGLGFMWITYVLLFFTAAVWDVWKRIIPNVLPAGLIVLFICAGLLSPSPVDWLSHLASGLLVLFVGAVLFGFGWLGGGDVKLWRRGRCGPVSNSSHSKWDLWQFPVVFWLL